MIAALGTQFPYDAGQDGQQGHAPEATWEALRALRPESIVIPPTPTRPTGSGWPTSTPTVRGLFG